MAPGGEGGLLGLAVAPVYAHPTASADNRIVLSGLAKAGFHDGRRIAFGPDGMLHAGVGDAGQTANAQNVQGLRRLAGVRHGARA